MAGVTQCGRHATPAERFQPTVHHQRIVGGLDVMKLLSAPRVFSYNLAIKQKTQGQTLGFPFNGEGGIRTRGTRMNPYNGLANRRFQPLSHLSGQVPQLVQQV